MKWLVDASHSEVQFKVKHLVISTVTGTFKEFEGALEAESEDFDNAKVDFSIKANSISTNQNDRDNHLKSGDFFDAEKYPSLSFKNGILKKKSKEDYSLTGELTIKDVTKTVELNVEYGGVSKDPWGNTKAGFEVTGKINRTEFGLTWNATLETGGVLVGESIALDINIQLVKA
ncbi:MAG: YceI family protein [Cytophagales bacterium]